MKKLILTLAFAILLSNLTFAQPYIPPLERYCTDRTNTLTKSEIANINGILQQFEDSTSTQIAVLFEYTIGNYPIESFAYQVAKENNIGQKGKNNGILFVILKKDRKMRIEVGYGLEGALPDALTSSIIRNDVKPHFKNLNFYDGVLSGIISIIAATKGEYKQDKTRSKNEDGFPWGTILFIIFFLIFFMGKGGRGNGLGMLWLGSALLNSSGGRSSGFSGSSFGGGGSFGGFSGGGGGFGGGGASGSW